jgi:ribonuclease P protein component
MLPKHLRLDLAHTKFHSATTAHGKLFRVRYEKTEDPLQTAVVVSKETASLATLRNRLKRKARATLLSVWSETLTGRAVLYPTKALDYATPQERKTELTHLFTKVGAPVASSV